jgi:hypothetical protein
LKGKPPLETGRRCAPAIRRVAVRHHWQSGTPETESNIYNCRPTVALDPLRDLVASFALIRRVRRAEDPAQSNSGECESNFCPLESYATSLFNSRRRRGRETPYPTLAEGPGRRRPIPARCARRHRAPQPRELQLVPTQLIIPLSPRPVPRPIKSRYLAGASLAHRVGTGYAATSRSTRETILTLHLSLPNSNQMRRPRLPSRLLLSSH